MAKLLKLVFLVIAALVIALGFLTLSPMLLAQNVNVRYDNVVWTVAYISGQQTYVPVPSAQVQICAYPANAVPCTNLATLFVGPTVLGGPSTNPVQADQFGNFGFWAAAGYYSYTVTNPLGQSAGPYPLTLGSSGGSGGTFALFPATQGIVFNTSTTSATTATSAQIVAALNNSPSTQLSSALIPPQPGIIPATTNLLKGSGSAGSAAVAVSGTDYLIPGALPNGTTATTQSPGDSSAKLATDAFVLANTTGAPGGANTQIQFNNSGVFGGSTLLFDPTTKSLTLGPNGTTAGSASGSLLFTSLYNNGSGLSNQVYDFHVQIGSGVNPFSQLVIDAPSGSPGGSQILALPAFHFAGNVEVQTGASLRLADATISSPVCTDAFSHLVTAGCSSGGGSTGVTPLQFGAKGDGSAVANGCTTNGTTTIVCPAGPFAGSVADVGKYVCVQGAGAAGATFCSQVATAVSNTTVIVSATPPTSVTQNPSFVGHDDVAALQACFNASSASGVQCILGTATPNQYLTAAGYLILSAGLTIPTHANITGASGGGQGTNILSEFNGDALSLPTSTGSLLAGQPIQGVTFSHVTLYMDPGQPNGRGIHLNAAAGVFGFGGMFYSTFDDVEVDSAAQECLWLDGGVSGADLPNQYITFDHLRCELPNQMHTAAAIRGTGQMAQIIFQNGAIDGSTTHSNEPNPLISFSGSGGKFPADVKFIGYTCEVATTCLYFGPSTTNLHYDSGYMEQVDNALIVDTAAQGFTFNGNHLANVGNGVAVAQFLGGVTGAMRDNYVYGGSTPTAWAVCSGSQNVVVQSGNNGTNLQTSGCALSIAVSGGTQNANSCSADTNITMPGITTDSVVTIGYGSASEAGVAGWGTTGGMRILARPSATNTMSWHLCNPTSGNITYGAYTFKWGFTQQ